MDSASYRPAQRFGWVPPSTLTAQHSVQVEKPATTLTELYDDAVPATPWAGTVALKPGDQDLAYWAPFSNDLPPTIIRRSRKVKPLQLPHGVKYPVMVALTVASLSSANLLSSATSTAQAAPADEDSTGSFQAVDPTQGDQDIVAAPADGGVGGGSATHAVQQGDTLKSIAANYGVDLSTLIQANGLANPDLIYPGDQIYIPGDANYAGSSVTVTVQPGDTLYKLANQYGVSVTAIINYEANGITNPDLIHPGQEITIPGGVAQASPEPVVEPQQEHSNPEPVSVEPEPEPEPQPEPQPEPEPEPEPEPQVEAQPEPEPQVEQQAAPAASSVGQQIVDIAMQFQGAPYVWGATGPSSFDCTGFTYYVVNQVLGGGFPRDMGSQASFGTPVSSDNLQPGDIVFQQNTYKAGMSHAGIYIGGGQFINAANESVGVTISNLWDSYWGPRYHSAVRIQ